VKIGVMLLTGPYQHEGSDTVYNFVKAALKKGHEVIGIFLYTDGVMNINKNIIPPGERNIAERFSELGAEGVKVYACVACSKFRGLKKDMAIENTKIVGLGKLADFIEEADRFITFGG
jgi:tRNA 2-thiouridine synthesizing protein D